MGFFFWALERNTETAYLYIFGPKLKFLLLHVTHYSVNLLTWHCTLWQLTNSQVEMASSKTIAVFLHPSVTKIKQTKKTHWFCTRFFPCEVKLSQVWQLVFKGMLNTLLKTSCHLNRFCTSKSGFVISVLLFCFIMYSQVYQTNFLWFKMLLDNPKKADKIIWWNLIIKMTSFTNSRAPCCSVVEHLWSVYLLANQNKIYSKLFEFSNVLVNFVVTQRKIFVLVVKRKQNYIVCGLTRQSLRQ